MPAPRPIKPTRPQGPMPGWGVEALKKAKKRRPIRTRGEWSPPGDVWNSETYKWRKA